LEKYADFGTVMFFWNIKEEGDSQMEIFFRSCFDGDD
jgi:hypothetical protein